MSRLAQTFALVGAVATVTLGGCNNVLGIDEAEPRPTVGISSHALEVPIRACNGPQPAACGACIATSCKNSRDKCLATNACREALNTYRKCLGAKCNDDSCLADLKAGPAKDLAGCALEGVECPACPAVTPLADICDLYCSCMEQPMPDSAGMDAAGQTCEQYDKDLLKDWTPGSHESCMAACLNLNDLTSTHCRWSHCELAQSGELGLHCGHAIDPVRCPLMLEVSSECKDRRINKWGCAKSDQCCSNRCVENICVD
jgi:hypothetical protein